VPLNPTGGYPPKYKPCETRPLADGSFFRALGQNGLGTDNTRRFDSSRFHPDLRSVERIGHQDDVPDVFLQLADACRDLDPSGRHHLLVGSLVLRDLGSDADIPGERGQISAAPPNWEIAST